MAGIDITEPTGTFSPNQAITFGFDFTQNVTLPGAKNRCRKDFFTRVGRKVDLIVRVDGDEKARLERCIQGAKGALGQQPVTETFEVTIPAPGHPGSAEVEVEARTRGTNDFITAQSFSVQIEEEATRPPSDGGSEFPLRSLLIAGGVGVAAIVLLGGDDNTQQ